MHDSSGVGGQERRADLFHDAARLSQVELAVRDQPAVGGAASEEAEHEVRTTGLAPIVVQRHDVGMLEPGHELRLGLEPLDEVRAVCQIGRITLIATSRLVPGCVAARTRPYAPSPSTSWMA